MPQIIIVGGGIIGMAQALKLLQKGFNVKLIERNSGVAQQCSAFNGNIYNPYFFLPLVCRDNVLNMMKSMFRAPELCTQRFKFNSFFEMNFFHFAINALLLSMTRQSIIRNSNAQVSLGKLMTEELKDIEKLGLLEGQLQCIGQVGFFCNQQKRDLFAQMNHDFQLDYHILNNFDDFIKLCKIPQINTPHNQKLFGNYKNEGILLPTESNINTFELTNDLLQYCQRHYSSQFEVTYNNSVDDFIFNKENKVVGLQTSQGPTYGDKFVVCMGLQSKYLMKKIKMNLPIIPARGWVLEGPIPEGGEHCILKYYTLQTPYYTGSIMNNKLRICGCAEVGKECYSTDLRNDWGTKSIVSKFEEQTDLKLDLSQYTIRDCNRPMTPDDVAIISKIDKYDNIYLNTGHGSRGMSYCFASAEILYNILEKNQPYPKYDVKRFYLI